MQKSVLGRQEEEVKQKNPRAKIPAEIRFWSRVNKTDSCWLWTGALSHGAYGTISTDKKQMGVHRFSWILHNGPIPNGLHVLHNCPGGDCTACVNPKHLWLGTQADNDRDRDEKGRTAKNEQHWRAKLTAQQVLEIRKLYTGAMGQQTALAKQFGVRNEAIWKIVHGFAWKNVLPLPTSLPPNSGP
jgi:hypothetical protein